jgi:hypothetical protein
MLDLSFLRSNAVFRRNIYIFTLRLSSYSSFLTLTNFYFFVIIIMPGTDLLKLLQFFIFLIKRPRKIQLGFFCIKQGVLGIMVDFLYLLAFVFMFHVNLTDSDKFGIDTTRTSQFVDRSWIEDRHNEKILVDLFLFIA